MKAVQNDMTAGEPMKLILSFTLPIFIGNVFQQFYNMADAVIVGKFVGNQALAAVGSTGTIMFLIFGFVVGMTAGFTVLTAQKFGAGDMVGMRRTVAGAGILSLAVGIFLTISFLLFMKPLLVLMHTPEDIFADAYAYIMIISGGILAQMLYNLLSSILRAIGNSKIPLYFLILSALLNIVLDLVFIVVFGLGAAGAAIATVIAQGVSGVLCLIYIAAKIPVLHLKREDFHVGSTILLSQLHVGIPMALQYSITAIGTMMVQSSLNILGSTLVAAVHRSREDRAAGDPGLCGHGNDHGDLRRPEYGSRCGAADPAGLSGVHDPGCDLRLPCGGLCHDRGKIYDIPVCFSGCTTHHGFGGHLPEMHRRVLRSAGGGEHLPQRHPGAGLRPAAHDGPAWRSSSAGAWWRSWRPAEEAIWASAWQVRRPGCWQADCCCSCTTTSCMWI